MERKGVKSRQQTRNNVTTDLNGTGGLKRPARLEGEPC